MNSQHLCDIDGKQNNDKREEQFILAQWNEIKQIAAEEKKDWMEKKGSSFTWEDFMDVYKSAKQNKWLYMLMTNKGTGSGGARPNAGRPKGSKNKEKKQEE